MKILLLNEHINPTVQNLIHYFSIKLGPNQFNWTGKRWYRESFLPFSEMEEISCVSEPIALTRLQDGYYDYVIFSDSSLFVFISSHLKSKTKRVIIDSIDSSLIPEYYWNNCEIYFKSQFKENTIISNINIKGNQKNIKSSDLNKKLYPFCLLTSFKINNDLYKTHCEENRENIDVYFSGSAWPKDRIKYISMLKQWPDINFFGGLYNRKDLSFNVAFPDNIKCREFNMIEYINLLKSSKINISLRGNGGNCIRQFEILYLGGFLLVQKTENKFAYIEPEDKKHCVFFNNESDLKEKIMYYLINKEERKEIAKNGKEFFDEYYNPRVLVNYILEVLENHEQ